jgi:hypothetical protein
MTPTLDITLREGATSLPLMPMEARRTMVVEAIILMGVMEEGAVGVDFIVNVTFGFRSLNGLIITLNSCQSGAVGFALAIAISILFLFYIYYPYSTIREHPSTPSVNHLRPTPLLSLVLNLVITMPATSFTLLSTMDTDYGLPIPMHRPYISLDAAEDTPLPFRRRLEQVTELTAENSTPYQIPKERRLSAFEKLPFEIHEQIYFYALPCEGYHWLDLYSPNEIELREHQSTWYHDCHESGDHFYNWEHKCYESGERLCTAVWSFSSGGKVDIRAAVGSLGDKYIIQEHSKKYNFIYRYSRVITIPLGAMKDKPVVNPLLRVWNELGGGR